MKHDIRLFALGALIPFALGGCDVFDESLIQEPEPVVPQGQAALLFGDKLDPSLPANLSFPVYHDAIDFNSFENSTSFLPSCLDEGDAPGSDIFFKIEMQAGDKWHFHVQTDAMAPAADPAIYVLDDWADPNRACSSPLSGINACGAKQPEHFSFIAPDTRPYYVGVDEVSGTNEPFKILAVRPECGNGLKDHSEYCDPSAPDPGTVADCEDCRKFLENGGDDGPGSVNDGPHDATKLKLPGSREFSYSVHGRIDTSCDFDFFSFTLDERTRVVAKLDDEEYDCQGVDLQFWDDDGESNPFGFSADETADCAEKSVVLSGGTHWIRAAGRPSLAGSNPAYRIDLEFETP